MYFCKEKHYRVPMKKKGREKGTSIQVLGNPVIFLQFYQWKLACCI